MFRIGLLLQLMLFSLGLLLPSRLRAEETGDSPAPQEAWIAFATENYFPLMEVTIASVHAFSTRPIIVVGINADLPFSTEQYPQLIKKRVEVDFSQGSIFNQKPRSILESGLDYGIYIEADDVLSAGCDTLFEYAHRETPYPLCPTHPADPNDQRTLMNALGVPEKTMPYVHGHVIFSKACMPFIAEWLQLCFTHTHLAPNFDETILNVLLWKHGTTEQVPLYDPFYQVIYGYLEMPHEATEQTPYSEWKMFHGCKDHYHSWDLLSQLKRYHQPDVVIPNPNVIRKSDLD